MTTITPAKALKAKNLLVKEISNLQEKIQIHNSSMVGAENPYNTKNLLSTLEQKIQELINLKTALSKANQPIQSKIYFLSELKSLVTHLKPISTTSGTIPGSRYGSAEPIVYIAQITLLELDELIKNKEALIASVQEDIDQFNHTAIFEY